MKRSTILLIAGLFIAICASAQKVSIPPTELVYTVNWKWGLVNLTVGEAHVTINCNNNELYGTLSGHSIPWESRIYSIADTLQAQVKKKSEKIRYINGWYRKPHVNSDPNLDCPENYRNIQGGGNLNASPSTMEAVSITANLIALYYYAQAIDFSSMIVGQSINVPINGAPDDCEMLQITYQGRGISSEYNNQPVYNIVLNYTYKGAVSSYPVACQISTATLYPVHFSANIKIGHVQMTLSE